MTKEALKLALEALELSHPRFGIGTAIHIKAVAVIKEALAQPEPEYLAFMDTPQRTWVGLTNEEVKKIVGSDRYTDLLKAVVQAVEAKLKEKNCG